MAKTATCETPASQCPIIQAQTHGSLLKRVWHSVTGAIVLGVFAGGMIVGGGWAMFLYNEPPVQYLTSQLVTSEVPVGGYLRFLVTVRPHVERPCMGIITREFYTVVPFMGDDGEVRDVPLKKRTPGPAPIVHEDEPPYLVDVDLPRNIWPGKWEFQGETAYDCGILWALANDFPRGVFNAGVIRLRTPKMPFQVVGAEPAK